MKLIRAYCQICGGERDHIYKGIMTKTEECLEESYSCISCNNPENAIPKSQLVKLTESISP